MTTFFLYILLYLTIGALISIHGRLKGWLPGYPAHVGMLMATWPLFFIYLLWTELTDRIANIGKKELNK